MDLSQRCRASVDRVLARYGWKLLAYDEYVRRVIACVHCGEVADPWSAAINVYCRCLHAACSGVEGSERQETAFVELHRYLYELSFREDADLPADIREDVLNETLLRIWRKLDTYRRPGAFLAIAAFELRGVIRPLWSRPVMLVPLDDCADQLIDPSDDLLDSTFHGEVRTKVQVCFDEAFRRHPDAKRQLEVVWLTYVGLDDKTISQCLGKSTATIYVLRKRGRDHLRNEPCWQELAREFGL